MFPEEDPYNMIPLESPSKLQTSLVALGYPGLMNPQMCTASGFSSLPFFQFSSCLQVSVPLPASRLMAQQSIVVPYHLYDYKCKLVVTVTIIVSGNALLPAGLIARFYIARLQTATPCRPETLAATNPKLRNAKPWKLEPLSPTSTRGSGVGLKMVVHSPYKPLKSPQIHPRPEAIHGSFHAFHSYIYPSKPHNPTYSLFMGLPQYPVLQTLNPKSTLNPKP